MVASLWHSAWRSSVALPMCSCTTFSLP